MLMDITAAGCFLVVASVMIAMWKFDVKSSRKDGQTKVTDKQDAGRKAGKRDE